MPSGGFRPARRHRIGQGNLLPHRTQFCSGGKLMTTRSEATADTSAGAEALVLQSGEGADFAIGQMRLTVKEAGERTAGQVVIMEIAVPAGASSPPPHIHH